MEKRSSGSAQAPSASGTIHSVPSGDPSTARNLKGGPLFDADTTYAAFAEPPSKLRKTQAHVDKSKGVGTSTSTSTSTHAQNASLVLQPNAASQAEDLPAIPYPIHHTRVEPSDPFPLRAPPRESLRNNAGRAGLPSPPVEAPRHPSGLSDYFPWERKHAEDVLTEQVTRSGYFEKAPNSSAELVSARPGIISCIRNKPACDAMSDLLVATLHRRQHLCSVSAKNNFKPPPRVTLTDNKREAWMRDLADGAIPLRRLSRTIPHGIRGQSLLDHCLAKHVPIWRAIWLLKCVGSNEIRAFRRKGAGAQTFGGSGGTKWLREWTDGVLDFVESLTKVADPVKAQGREHITYALSLTSHVYHEQLLDKNAFTHGLIRRLAKVPNTDCNAFCLWISIVGQYISDLLKCRQRGGDLVKCLLSALDSLQSTEASKTPAVALAAKCRKLLTKILEDHPANFVLPEQWHKWNNLIRGLIKDDDFRLQDIYRDLESRNALLCPGSGLCPPSESEQESGDSVQLDIFDSEPDPESFVSALRQLTSDSSEMIRLPVSWCTSYQRPGISAIYLVARAIRIISKRLSLSCQDDLAHLLASVGYKDQVQAHRLCMLVAELVRSHHFSVSKYLHYLLARGTSSFGKTHLALLSYIPRQALSTEVVNLASGMCTASNCPSISDKDEVEFQVAAMQLAISRCRPSNGLTSKDRAHISSLDVGTKSAIALRLRKDIVTKRAEQSYPSPYDNDSMDMDMESWQSRLPATLAAFELLQDFPTLADVLLLFIPSASAESLLVLVACVEYHHKAFWAMSALQRLFTDLLKRYAMLYTDGVRDINLTRSMLSLAHLLPNAKQTQAVLQSQLGTNTTANSEMVRSPLSDNMLDTLSSRDVGSVAELEALLQGVNVIEEGFMLQILGPLLSILDTSQKDPEQMVRVLKLLGRLAELNKAKFSSFLAKHIHSMLTGKDPEHALRTLPWIIAGNLCPVDELMSNCLRLTADAGKKDQANTIATNLLVSIASPPNVNLCNCVLLYYTFRTIQEDLFQTKREKLARLAELALQTASFKRGSWSQTVEKQTWAQSLEQIIFVILCDARKHADSLFEDNLMQLHSSGVPIEDMLTRMTKLHSGRADVKQASFAPMTLLHKVSEIVKPETSVPCRLLAQIELNKLEQTCAPHETLEQAAASFVSEASVWRRMSCWPELTRNLSATFTTILHETALDGLLRSIKPYLIKADASVFTAETYRQNTRYFHDMVSLLNATQAKVTTECLLKSVGVLSDLLDGLSTTTDWQELTPAPSGDLKASDVAPDTFDKALCLMLHLTATHCQPVNLSMFPTEGLINLITVLSKLYINVSDVPEIPESTITTLTDIILHLTRPLTEEGRVKCSANIFRGSGQLPRQLEEMLGHNEQQDDVSQFLLEINDGSDTVTSPSGTPQSVSAKNISFNIDAWEMLQDTTPMAGRNDACLSLRLFGARRAVI